MTQIRFDNYLHPKAIVPTAVDSTDVIDTGSLKADGYSFVTAHISWTLASTWAGTWVAYGSNIPGEWIDLGVDFTVLNAAMATAASDFGLAFDPFGYEFFRLAFTNSAGSATVQVAVKMKAVT